MQRLILGPGPAWPKQPGDVFCDIRQYGNIDVVHDLNNAWPFDDNLFIHVSAIHVVEHLNDLVHFMDEAHRVLSPGGSLYIETPLAGGDVDLEYADPTHKRCYRIHTFVNYFSPEGAAKFQYTDKAWNFFHLHTRDNCIFVHAYPIKT